MDDWMNVLLDGCMTGLMNICMHRRNDSMDDWMEDRMNG